MKLSAIGLAIVGAVIGTVVGFLHDYSIYLTAAHDPAVPPARFVWQLSLVRSAKVALMGLGAALGIGQIPGVA